MTVQLSSSAIHKNRPFSYSRLIVRLLIAFPGFGRHQMRVPEQIKKCVGFIGFKPREGSRELFIGTVLFLGNATTGRCMITARHVIDVFKKNLADYVWLRVNAKAGGCEWVSTDLNNWICSEDPSLDVAVHFGCLNDQADHMILDRQLALMPDIAKALSVGVGDEIFITGLFANYTGGVRNAPIVRVGNLAAYPEERIRVRLEERLQERYVEIDAYLIEARSIGGLSGSPVFYHSHGSHKGVYRPSFPDVLSPFTPIEEQSFYLMGIVKGHYDQDRDDIEKVNTGIAYVTPIGKILDFIDAEQSKR